MVIGFWRFFSAHLFGVSATGAIARFCGSLAGMLGDVFEFRIAGLDPAHAHLAAFRARLVSHFIFVSC